MNLEETLDALREAGTEQNRKVYTRHGVTEPMLGVSFANLGVLKKRIKVDHDLAIALWETGIHDARILATMIADPTRSSAALLDGWSLQVNNYVLADALSKLAAQTPEARKLAAKWVDNKNEWASACGWNIYALLAMDGWSLTDSDSLSLLTRIERDLPKSPNRVRHAMNNTLIALGMRSEQLAEAATAAASRIGKVEVDHGETGCKTPEAGPYIKKARERAQALQTRKKKKSG